MAHQKAKTIEVEIEQADLDVLNSLRRPMLGEEVSDVIMVMLNALDRRRESMKARASS